MKTEPSQYKWMSEQQKTNPKRYRLPEEDRERLTRNEMNAIIYYQAARAAAATAREHLDSRLECIPSGKQRFSMALGAMSAVVDDILGTVPRKSMDRLINISDDFKLDLVLKAGKGAEGTLVMPRADARVLVDAAFTKCQYCVKSDAEARKECPLYKVFEAYFPLNGYGDGGMCQYGKDDIE